MKNTSKEGYPLTLDNPRAKSQPTKLTIDSAIIARRRRRAKIAPAWKIIPILILFVVTAAALHTINKQIPEAGTEWPDVPLATDNPLPFHDTGSMVTEISEPERVVEQIPRRYELTEEERLLVAQVVMAESEGEPFAGKVAVAQCILNTCEIDGIRPGEAVVKYKYAKARPEPSEESLEAVNAVFDSGYIVAKDPIMYFYNPAKVASSFHESQIFVIEINNHRFFKEAPKK